MRLRASVPDTLDQNTAEGSASPARLSTATSAHPQSHEQKEGPSAVTPDPRHELPYLQHQEQSTQDAAKLSYLHDHAEALRLVFARPVTPRRPNTHCPGRVLRAPIAPPGRLAVEVDGGSGDRRPLDWHAEGTVVVATAILECVVPTGSEESSRAVVNLVDRLTGQSAECLVPPEAMAALRGCTVGTQVRVEGHVRTSAEAAPVIVGVSMRPAPIARPATAGAGSPRVGDVASQPDSTTAEALRRLVADQVGPRWPGAVYDTGDGAFKVLHLTTIPGEARRLLGRRGALFAITVRNLDTGEVTTIGTAWNTNDRVRVPSAVA